MEGVGTQNAPDFEYLNFKNERSKVKSICTGWCLIQVGGYLIQAESISATMTCTRVLDDRGALGKFFICFFWEK